VDLAAAARRAHVDLQHDEALLAEELPAMIADLRALGVEAGVRVVADG
jgi:hypothetical protein